MVMAANSGGYLFHYWAGLYGGCAHIYAPGGQRGPFAHLPYGIDNGAFAAFDAVREWDEAAFRKLLDWTEAAAIAPLWVAAPDVVTDAKATLDRWDGWAAEIRERGLPAALVVQDGMTPADVRACEPDAVFVGGSTEWKWLWMYRFCDSHPRVHVGRVNGYRPLLRCYDAGVESCDGTGWFRGDQVQVEGLRRFLHEQSEDRVPSPTPLFAGSDDAGQ